MPRRNPKSLSRAGRPASPTPEERLLAHQAFRYEVGILRAWENVRHASARAADPRTWIRRHPMGTVLATGALAAIFMMRGKRAPAPPGIRTAITKAGFSLLRRAAISGFMTRVVWRLWGDAPPASLEECEASNSIDIRRNRRYRHPVKW